MSVITCIHELYFTKCQDYYCRIGRDWFGSAIYILSPFSPFLLERINQTVEITKHTVDIEEKGVKLKLTIVDTPGFGDAVNNNEW